MRSHVYVSLHSDHPGDIGDHRVSEIKRLDFNEHGQGSVEFNVRPDTTIEYATIYDEDLDPIAGQRFLRVEYPFAYVYTVFVTDDDQYFKNPPKRSWEIEKPGPKEEPKKKKSFWSRLFKIK